LSRSELEKPWIWCRNSALEGEMLSDPLANRVVFAHAPSDIPLMFFLFTSKRVWCPACEQETRSKVNPLYQAAWIPLVLLTYFAFRAGVPLPRRIGFGSASGFHYTSGSFDRLGWLLPAGLSAWLLFNRNAHSCSVCDSPYITKISKENIL